MRKKNNLNRFGHTGKDSHQKRRYAEMVEGPQMRGTTTDLSPKRNFEETSVVDGVIEDGEKISKKSGNGKKPYESWNTRLEENKFGIAVTIIISIVLGIGGWAILTVNESSKTVDSHTLKIDSNTKDIEKIEGKVDELNDSSIRQEKDIEGLQKDVDELGQNKSE